MSLSPFISPLSPALDAEQVSSDNVSNGGASSKKKKKKSQSSTVASSSTTTSVSSSCSTLSSSSIPTSSATAFATPQKPRRVAAHSSLIDTIRTTRAHIKDKVDMKQESGDGDDEISETEAVINTHHPQKSKGRENETFSCASSTSDDSEVDYKTYHEFLKLREKIFPMHLHPSLYKNIYSLLHPQQRCYEFLRTALATALNGDLFSPEVIEWFQDNLQPSCSSPDFSSLTMPCVVYHKEEPRISRVSAKDDDLVEGSLSLGSIPDHLKLHVKERDMPGGRLPTSMKDAMEQIVTAIKSQQTSIKRKASFKTEESETPTKQPRQLKREEQLLSPVTPVSSLKKLSLTSTPSSSMAVVVESLDNHTKAMVEALRTKHKFSPKTLFKTEAAVISQTTPFTGKLIEAAQYYQQITAAITRYNFEPENCLRIVNETMKGGARAWYTSVIARFVTEKKLSGGPLLKAVLQEFKDQYLNVDRALELRRQLAELRISGRVNEDTLTAHFASYQKLAATAELCGETISDREMITSFRKSLPTHVIQFIGRVEPDITLDELYQRALEAVKTLPPTQAITRDPASTIEINNAMIDNSRNRKPFDSSRRAGRGGFSGRAGRGRASQLQSQRNQSMNAQTQNHRVCFFCGNNDHDRIYNCLAILKGKGATQAGRQAYEASSLAQTIKLSYDDWVEQQMQRILCPQQPFAICFCKRQISIQCTS